MKKTNIFYKRNKNYSSERFDVQRSLNYCYDSSACDCTSCQHRESHIMDCRGHAIIRPGAVEVRYDIDIELSYRPFAGIWDGRKIEYIPLRYRRGKIFFHEFLQKNLKILIGCDVFVSEYEVVSVEDDASCLKLSASPQRPYIDRLRALATIDGTSPVRSVLYRHNILIAENCLVPMDDLALALKAKVGYGVYGP